MAESAVPVIERPKRIRFDWIPGVLFFPRKTFAEITAQTQAVWLTPLLLLTITAILLVVVAGPIKRNNFMMQGPTYPENWEFMSPDQQAQFMQAWEATQKPVFLYIFPAALAVGKIWLGWLIVGGLLHLVLTMLGGRGSTAASMNIVAWAGLPFAVRDIVQIVFLASQKTLVAGQGLAGFVSGEGGFFVFLTRLLAAVDIYLIWNILLIVLGVRASNGLTRGKALTGVLITILLVIAFQALLGFLTSLLSGMSVTRPFFF
jgi:hypothetical protein